ncbi:MAG: hypothetical protein WBL48_04860, partial [Pseudolabrys sp.]
NTTYVSDTLLTPSVFLQSAIKWLVSAMCAMYGPPPKFCPNKARPASMTSLGVLDCQHVNKGGTAVDLALKLNVLAVCAVFAFVGAILLGAF